MKIKNTIRITKRFGFEAAHVLEGYDGLCKNIHGHSYVLFVTLKGHISEDTNDPKLGMLMDFSSLKQIVNDKIIKIFDHSLMLIDNTSINISSLFNCEDSRIIKLPFQPTCENLVVHFAEIIKSGIPQNITLHSLKLYETETSYAEWFAEDNQ
jgi:6-pyruvoyltetrahydropterin/6-carboxytetrahydropterin synthase